MNNCFEVDKEKNYWRKSSFVVIFYGYISDFLKFGVISTMEFFVLLRLITLMEFMFRI